MSLHTLGGPSGHGFELRCTASFRRRRRRKYQAVMTCERIHHVFRKRVGSGTAEDAKRAGTSLCTCLCTQNIAQQAGPFSVARLKMDLPFHNRLAYNRVHRRSASPLRPSSPAGRLQFPPAALRAVGGNKRRRARGGNRQHRRELQEAGDGGSAAGRRSRAHGATCVRTTLRKAVDMCCIDTAAAATAAPAGGSPAVGWR